MSKSNTTKPISVAEAAKLRWARVPPEQRKKLMTALAKKTAKKRWQKRRKLYGPTGIRQIASNISQVSK